VTIHIIDRIKNDKKIKAMRRFLFLIIALSVGVNLIAQMTVDLPKVVFVDYQPENREWFVRYGQFQINFEYEENPSNGLVLVKNTNKQIERISKCLEIAKKSEIDVIVFPEVTMSLPKDIWVKTVKMLEKYSKENDAIIIAGTFYDNNRTCKNLIVLPTGIYYTYKIRPSIFEASPIGGEGMLLNDTLHVFRTKYGNFLTIVCVDLISDDANYIARNLSNKGLIDMLININFNPKSQEFMREASSMVVRHPLFVSLTNVSLFKSGCTIDGNEYGNTSIFGSITSFDNNSFRSKLLTNIPDCYKTQDKKQLQPAYKSLLGIISPEIEGVLIYDLNLRVIRTPQVNNAPDQGYPTIKNIEVIEISNKKTENE